MHAVIMAAGLGNRLGDLTKDRPKALVPVFGRELILRTLDAADHPAITRRTVVTGYMGAKLAAFLRERRPDVGTVENPRFAEGSVLSVEAALAKVDGDMLLMNVDHIYPRRLIARVVEPARGITAVCDFDRELGPDDMKVKLDAAGQIAGIRKTLTDYDCGYIGMTVCPAAMLPAYRKAAAQTRAEDGDSANAEAVLAHMAKREARIGICDASGIGWLEVDNEADLANAESALRGNAEFLL